MPASSSSLRPCDPGPGDPVQGLHHHGLQAGRPAGGGHGQHLLGGQAEVAGLPHARGDLLGAGAGRGGDRADGELLGQAQAHPSELRGDQALAQVADRGQQLGRGPGQQGSETAGQRQPAPGPLQVAAGLGDRLVLHRAPLRLPCSATRKVGPWAVAAPVILFNAHDGRTHPACHLESVREAECQPGMSAATVR